MFVTKAIQFLQERGNKNYLIMIADPETDVMVVANAGKCITSRIARESGNNMHLVRDVLKYNKVNRSIDQFLLFMDGAIYNLAKSLDPKIAAERLLQSKNDRSILKEEVISNN